LRAYCICAVLLPSCTALVVRPVVAMRVPSATMVAPVLIVHPVVATRVPSAMMVAPDLPTVMLLASTSSVVTAVSQQQLLLAVRTAMR
jgi:hypothetical protein